MKLVVDEEFYDISFIHNKKGFFKKKDYLMVKITKLNLDNDKFEDWFEVNLKENSYDSFYYIGIATYCKLSMNINEIKEHIKEDSKECFEQFCFKIIKGLKLQKEQDQLIQERILERTR